MYSREVDGRARSFGVSGRLWHSVLVLYDRETESYWTQIDGRAITGPETGKRLEHVPSVFTTFGSWLDAHPDTLVLAKTERARALERSVYARYFEDPEELRFPHVRDDLDDTVPPKTVVFGVRAPGGPDGGSQRRALAVTEAVLVRDTVVNAALGELPVALLRDRITGAVEAVVRRVDGRAVELEPAPRYEATERVRDATSGEVLRVDRLEPLRVDRAFWFAWARTMGDTTLIHE